VKETDMTIRSAVETEAAPLRTVTETLSRDHDRLDALEEAAFAQRSAGDFPMACALYEEFAAGLRRHIGFEEEILFPAFEQRTGIPPTAGPTAVMRVEHREIEDLLKRICAGMADAEAPAEALRRRFHAVLVDHNIKEERVLYPTTDRLLGPEDSDALVASIQRFTG
jgi:iron-sulfur cluster repair protein YtfE (RIC family)